MSSYLRPRRGKQSTAASTLTSSNPLKRGEIFFEVPTSGVGSGQGKIKMGDGSTAYGSLPYFMSMDDSVVTFTDSSASSTWENCNSYLGNIKTNISLPTFFANTKNLLYQLVSKVTSLNNDLVPRHPNNSVIKISLSLENGFYFFNTDNVKSYITNFPDYLNGKLSGIFSLLKFGAICIMIDIYSNIFTYNFMNDTWYRININNIN